MTTEEQTETVTFTVNDQEMTAPKGELLIRAAQQNGLYIPRFCWHPRMSPVGMCRMCLVEMDSQRGPMIVTACTTKVDEGMTIHTHSPMAAKAQEGILEYLLINHPLDCPVCDKGGECPLQDQTMGYGPGETRFVEEKRHYEKPIEISDLVMLDRERCILCGRCTRFSEEISGDPLLVFLDRGSRSEVNTFPDEPFRSYFSGNTVQICPVGALTATAYRFRARPWDLREMASVCPHCSAGDAITVQTSQNQVLRFLGVDNPHTNQSWLSDKCRFGFEYINSPDRLTAPLVRGDDAAMVETTWSEALDLVAGRLSAIVAEHGGTSVAGLGGARGTNEDAYAFSRFLRTVVGTNHLDCRMDDAPASQFLAATADRATIDDIDGAATILVWGPDLKEEHPTLYLRIRTAATGHDPNNVMSNSDGLTIRRPGTKLIVVHPRRNGLDDVARHTMRYRPGAGGELLAALQAGEHPEIDQALEQGPLLALVGKTGATEDPRLAESVAAWLRDKGARVMPLARRANTFGALDMGVAPDLLPGRVSLGDGVEAWGDILTTPGRDTRGILEGLASGDLKAVIMMGADPVADVADADLARRALDEAELVVSIDLFHTESVDMADVVLPALGFAEKEGTVTNLEGRVQKVNDIVPGAGQSRADWSIIDDIAGRMGRSMGYSSSRQIGKEISEVAPAYRGITWDLLEWDQRDGVVVPAEGAEQPLEYVPVASSLPSVSAEMVLHSARTMYDDGAMMRHGLSLHRLAPGAAAHLHPDDARRLGVRPGDMVRLSTDTSEAELEVVFDQSLHHGVVYVPFNQPGGPSLGSSPVVDVTATL
ncbi:MAG: NADH-quinone oxidoreductase subunit NuoG [Acidimicrobiia bacterium]